jgi:presenilin-like A22 family membrane protease
MNLFSAFVLLFLISLYDMFSVWQSKHMIKLAEFQTSQKLFAGIFIPYSIPKKQAKTSKSVSSVKKTIVEVKSAILGGGDIGFPLIFAGVIFKSLVLIDPVPIAFLKAIIISITTALALLWLFIKAEKDKYYPAMPFISIGCVIGYLIVFILSFFI